MRKRLLFSALLSFTLTLHAALALSQQLIILDETGKQTSLARGDIASRQNIHKCFRHSRNIRGRDCESGIDKGRSWFGGSGWLPACWLRLLTGTARSSLFSNWIPHLQTSKFFWLS